MCKKWQERECVNVDCVLLHPGGLGVWPSLHVCHRKADIFITVGVKRSSDSNNDEVRL